MSALARFSKDFLGIGVSGSDRRENDNVRMLRSEGIPVVTPHSEGALPADADLVVRSLAVPPDAPECLAARERGIPIIDRPSYLGALMRRFPSRVGVMGTHGKSTVTAMIDAILSGAGKNPSTVSGANLTSGAPFRLGGGEIFIYEACEYRRAFLSFFPTVSVLTNVELDHTDCYTDLNALTEAFSEALSKTERVAILNVTDPGVAVLAKQLSIPIITVGEGEGADLRITKVAEVRGYYRFTLETEDSSTDFSLSVPGAHQVKNAALAAATAKVFGISYRASAELLKRFHGIGDRIEALGTVGTLSFYRDYAHHPTEIRAGIRTIREMTGGAVNVVFCPHTFTRTRDLWDGFAESLSEADQVFLLPVYPAREDPIPGVSSDALAAAIEGAHAITADGVLEAVSDLSGSVILMGAGDFTDVLKKLGFGEKKIE